MTYPETRAILGMVSRGNIRVALLSTVRVKRGIYRVILQSEIDHSDTLTTSDYDSAASFIAAHKRIGE